MLRSFLALTLACAIAAPLAAQQSPAASSPVSVSAAAPAAQAGPRVPAAMPRVEARFKNGTAALAPQDNVDVNHNYLVYILVVAVLVVLLIFLIKRA